MPGHNWYDYDQWNNVSLCCYQMKMKSQCSQFGVLFKQAVNLKQNISRNKTPEVEMKQCTMFGIQQLKCYYLHWYQKHARTNNKIVHVFAWIYPIPLEFPRYGSEKITKKVWNSKCFFYGNEASFSKIPNYLMHQNTEIPKFENNGKYSKRYSERSSEYSERSDSSDERLEYFR